MHLGAESTTVYPDLSRMLIRIGLNEVTERIDKEKIEAFGV